MSIAALKHRIDRLIEQIDPRHPKTWMVVQEQGLGIPEQLAQELGPRDTVLVREYPKGYLGPDVEPVFYSR